MTDTTGAQELSVFGRVLAELMESRGIEPNASEVAELAEASGLDAGLLLERMKAGSGRTDLGYLDGMAAALALSEPERMRLAVAYTFERDTNAARGS